MIKIKQILIVKQTIIFMIKVIIEFEYLIIHKDKNQGLESG